jgi:site-specific recombinase XerD
MEQVTQTTMPLPELVDWWVESLGAHTSARTRKLYRGAADALVTWLQEAGLGVDTVPGRAVIDRYFAEMRARPNKRTGRPLSPSYVNQHWRSLQQFYRWLAEEELIERNPFVSGMRQPPVPDRPIPVFTDDELTRLFKATEGKSPADRRDRAIIRLMLDTGVRVGELCGLRLDHVDFSQKIILVVGKASHARTVPFNAKAYSELKRWLLVRPQTSRDGHEGGPLFTDLRGRGTALTESGVRQMLERRAELAGVADIHPHRFRHTAAHLWMAHGGLETDLQRIMGWRSSQMVYRYAASAGVERAQASARRLAIADRF